MAFLILGMTNQTARVHSQPHDCMFIFLRPTWPCAIVCTQAQVANGEDRAYIYIYIFFFFFLFLVGRGGGQEAREERNKNLDNCGLEIGGGGLRRKRLGIRTWDLRFPKTCHR